MTSNPEISVVIPLFNEADNLPELYRRLTTSLEAFGVNYELLLVNDGSRDDTGKLLDQLQTQDHRVLSIHLSRNFGHQAAFSAGIDLAHGEAVILMDGDLQDPPEVLDQFIAAWRGGHDVVYAIRTRRKEHLLKRCAYAVFYRLLRGTSHLDIPLDSGDFCLMDRRVVEVLRLLPERERFLRGLRSFAGFRQIGLRYERAARHAGQPKYTLRALVRLALDGLVGFSHLPLTLVSWLGGLSFTTALVVTTALLLSSLNSGSAPSGWACALLVTLWLGAVQLLSLGILGEYVRRIFAETRGRPTYLIDRVGPKSGEGGDVSGHRDRWNQVAVGDRSWRWDSAGAVAEAGSARTRR